jgi:hypothetical protein
MLRCTVWAVLWNDFVRIRFRVGLIGQHGSATHWHRPSGRYFFVDNERAGRVLRRFAILGASVSFLPNVPTLEDVMWFRALFLLVVCVGVSCGTNDDPFARLANRPDVPAMDVAVPKYAGPQIVLLNSTVQLVNAATQCPSGWSWLVEQLTPEDQGHLPPIQPRYVDRFATVAAMHAAILDGVREFASLDPIVRVSLVWPCWAAEDGSWKRDMLTMLDALQDANLRVEIILSQHDSYPASLIDMKVVGPLHGWAHDNAVAEFLAYATDVMNQLEDHLAKGSRVYLVHEPMLPLFKGYLWEQAWPPNQRFAQSSLVHAMRNLASALRSSAEVVVDAGHVPVIGKNIRLVNAKPEDPIPSRTLNRLINWWLTDVLYRGCADNNFDGMDDIDGVPCETVRRTTLFAEAGITFYGSMWVGSDPPMLVRVDDETTLTIGVGIEDPSPSSTAFEAALSSTLERYPWMTVHVAEIGFTAPPFSGKQRQWLRAYLEVYDRVQEAISPNVGSIGIHALFQHAEFTSGDHFFHLATGCGTSFCEVTPWGRDVLDEFHLRYTPRP